MTPRTLEAVYEAGVLRPLEALDLPEHLRVRVTISESDQAMGDTALSCFDLARQAGIIGALKNAPNDLSTNPEYLRGFGE